MGRGGRGPAGPKKPSEDFMPGTAFSVNCGKCQQLNNMSFRMCEEFAFTCGHCGAENAANTRAIMASYCSAFTSFSFKHTRMCICGKPRF